MTFEGKIIKNIIFDLGGVIINIDFKSTQRAFEELGISNFDSLYSHSKQNGLFDDFETGKISAVHFREQIRTISGKNIDDKSIDDAWNAMLLDIPIERIKLLEQLKQKYKTFVLSNTNEIHIDAFSQQIENNIGLSHFNSLFNNIYYSNEIGLRKPESAIFNKVLTDSQLKAEETLFIDDSIQHIEGAIKTGIHTLHLTGGKTILDVFSDQIKQ